MQLRRCAAAVVCLAALSTRSLAQPATQPAAPPPETYNDPGLPADAKDVEIVAGMDGAAAEIGVEKRSPSHYVIRSTQTRNTGGQYFLIHLTGVAGRTVQLDFEGMPFAKWGNAVPQYSYVEDLDAPESFDAPSTDVAADAMSERPADGEMPALPETSKQGWHYVSTVMTQGERISIRQKFERESAFVAFKVPYTPGYSEAFLDLLHDDPMLKVAEVGKSTGGRPLQVAVIAKEHAAGAPPRPCVLIYAREHPDDQDGSWITQGAIFTLVSNEPDAVALRDACDFIVVPMLDPDGVLTTAHENIAASFIGDGETPEATAYIGWFKKWFETGHRVDVAIALHSSVPGSNFHLACPLMEGDPPRQAALQALHKQIRDKLTADGFTIRNTPWTTKGGNGPVLCGWLQSNYGTLPIPYVSASLQSKAQLNLTQLRQMGATITKGSAAFLESVDGMTLMKQIDDARANAAKPATNP